MKKLKNYFNIKKWILPDVPTQNEGSLLGAVLLARGVDDQDGFLNSEYTSLADPFEIPGMEDAVAAINQAVASDTLIAIYGDYDVDGVSATALLSDFFNKIGARSINYIPSRNNEGYGLNTEAIDLLASQGVGLIVTVDCGSVSFDEVDYAKNLGVKMVITDHHTLKSAGIPSAEAVVSPKRLEPDHRLYELAGVGVAFYLARALQPSYYKFLPEGQERWLLDLVVLGTVCDIVPLVGENRILARYGLKVLAKSRREGIRALAAVSEVSLDFVDSYKIGFLLGPRLNAAGRIEHANAALELLTTSSCEKAASLAQQLNELNLIRQETTEKIVEEARDIILADDNKKSAYLLFGKDWPAGVVGIVASRLMEEFGKPMLIMEDMGEELKGSARSVKDVNIVEALTDSGELLAHYGGHAFAAGFSLKKDKFVLFEDRLLKYIDGKITEADLTPEIIVDVLAEPNQITTKNVLELKQLEPFGRGNTKPIFAIMNTEVVNFQLVGNPAVHLKFQIKNGTEMISGIAFGWGEEPVITAENMYDIAFTLDINDWRDQKRAELRLVSIRESRS